MAIRKLKKSDSVKTEKKTKKIVKEEPVNPNIGKLLFLEPGEIENPVLGKLYDYKDLKVRVVHRGDKIKVEVEA